MTHRRDIEGLRALAVLAVVLYHFEVPGVGGGFIGVDVFFVVSGFLITSLLLAEREREGRVSLAAFYARRIRRLLPISATVLVATALVSLAWLEPTRLEDLAADLRASALFAANFLFADRGADYLTSDLPASPLQHFWSLGVEEQFYLVWPVVLVAVCVGSRNVRARLTAALVAIGAASLTASVVLTPGDPSWSYYGPHTRAWELAAGAGLAVASSRLAGAVSATYRSTAAWIGIGLVAASAASYGSVTDFPGIVAVVPVAGTVLALMGGDDAPRGPTRVLSLAPLQYLGSRSYSLYLWHWPALVLAESRLGRDLNAADKVLVAAATLALSELGYRIVEQPARRSPVLTARAGLTGALGAAMVVSGLAASAVVANHDPDLGTGVTAQVPALATSTTVPEATTTTAPGPIDTAGASAPVAVADALRVKVLPDNLRPALRRARFDTPVIYDNSCHRFESSRPKAGCVYGDPTSSFTVALWGDSHAAQWFSPLADIAEDRGWRLVSVTQGSCGYLDVLTFNTAKRSVQRNCPAWREAAREMMRTEGVDAVFLSQFNGMREASTRDKIGPARWRETLPPLVASLRADGIEPVILADTPNPPDVVPECLARNKRSILSCTTKAADGWNERIDAVHREVAADLGVGLVEPARWLCHEGRCPAVIGDILVYRDDNHVSDTAMAWLRPVIDAAISPFLEHVRNAR